MVIISLKKEGAFLRTMIRIYFLKEEINSQHKCAKNKKDRREYISGICQRMGSSGLPFHGGEDRDFAFDDSKHAHVEADATHH